MRTVEFERTTDLNENDFYERIILAVMRDKINDEFPSPCKAEIIEDTIKIYTQFDAPVYSLAHTITIK